MTIQDLLKLSEAELKSALDHLGGEFAGLQIGRASGALVESLSVESYGSFQPLKNLASISVPDAKTVAIQPWDRSTLAAIEKAIRESSINLNPNNDGVRILLSVPPLTEERRRDLVKVVKQKAEDGHISVRRVRQDIITKAKQSVKDSVFTEDDSKYVEKRLQEQVDEVNKKIDALAKQKEEDIMKV